MIWVPGSHPDFPFVPGVEPPEGTDDDLVYLFRHRRLLVWREGDRSRVPTRRELAELAVLDDRTVAQTVAEREERIYLGRLESLDAWVGAVEPEADDAEGAPADDWHRVEVPEGMAWGDLRGLAWRLEEPQFWVGGRAVQVLEWDRTHRFCGRCAAPTENHPSDRAKVCPRCGLHFYPRLAPAVIVLVEKDDKVLLARSPRFVQSFFSTLAGFVEAGESLEQAVLREIEEEVGIRVGDLRYFGSQPWPFPNSLMVGFRATWKSGTLRPDPAEIAEAGWFARDDLPQIPPSLSIARSLIDAWMAEGR